MLAVFTLAQILNYPFPEALVRDEPGTAIAYTLVQQGVRTLWFARAPDWGPVQLFSSGADDGQELSNLAISKGDSHVVYVRGGDHDANWSVPLQPGPQSMPQEPEMQVWSVATAGGASKLLGNGDAPAISPDGTRVAFASDGAVMIAPIDASVAAKRLLLRSRTGFRFAMVARRIGSCIRLLAHRSQLRRDLSQRYDPDPVPRADDLARFYAALVARRNADRVHPGGW